LLFGRCGLVREVGWVVVFANDQGVSDGGRARIWPGAGQSELQLESRDGPCELGSWGDAIR